MQKKWLSLLAVPVVAVAAMSLLAAGAPQRDGARLLDQVMARLQREAIDSISQDEIYERAARGLVRQIDDPYAALFSPEELARFSRESLGNSYGGVGLLIEDQDGLDRRDPGLRRHPGRARRHRGWRPDPRGQRRVGEGLQARPGVPPAAGHAGHAGGPDAVPRGCSGPAEVHLIRATVHVPSVPIAIVLEGGIGYVSLQRFNDVASEELGRAVDPAA